MTAIQPVPKKKRPTNLSLAQAQLAFGHRYAEGLNISLSQVVNDLLGALEQTVQGLNVNTDPAEDDPLDGLLAGWPNLDKKELRKAQHKARLAR
ncbi:MAG: hypothetical protein IPQ13_15020 [Holophagaceae bacterium]|nr:hypothetical protein [Holophagaceae bacterium]